MQWFGRRNNSLKKPQISRIQPDNAISDALLDKMITTHVRVLAMFHPDEQSEIKKCIFDVAKERMEKRYALNDEIVSLLQSINERIMSAASRHRGFGVSFDSVDEIRAIVLEFASSPKVEFERAKEQEMPISINQAMEASTRINTLFSELNGDLWDKLSELEIECDTLSTLFLFLRDFHSKGRNPTKMNEFDTDSLVIFAQFAFRLADELLNEKLGADKEMISEFLARGNTNTYVASSILQNALKLVEDVERIRSDCRGFLDTLAKEDRKSGKEGDIEGREAKAAAERVLKAHKGFSNFLDSISDANGYGRMTQEYLSTLLKHGEIDDKGLIVLGGTTQGTITGFSDISVRVIAKITDILDDGIYAADVKILMDFYHGVQAKKWGPGGNPSDEEQYPEIATALFQIANLKAMKTDCEAFLKRVGHKEI